MAQQFGMFGPTPWEIEQMRQQQGMAADMAAARMTPDQHGVMVSGQAGRALGGAINQGMQALGVPMPQDEQMENAKKMQQINKELQASGINPSDTEKYLSNLGEKLAQAGLTKEAMNVSTALQEHRMKQTELDTKKYDSETARIKAEAFKQSKLKSPLSQEIFKKNKEYTPASLQKYLESITDENPNGNVGLLEPLTEPSGWNSDGLTPDGRFVFTNDKGEVGINQNGKIVPYNGPIAKGKNASDTKVSVGMPDIKVTTVNEAPTPGMSAASSEMMGAAGKKALEDHTKLMTTINNLEPYLGSVEEIINKKGPLITGTGADIRLAAERAKVTGARMLGGNPDASALNNTDQLKQYTQMAVLPLLAQVGGSDTEKEQDNLRKALANNTLTYEMVDHSVKIARQNINRVKAKQNEWQAVLNDPNEKNHDRFWATGGNRTTNRTPDAAEAGKSRVTREAKGTPAEVAADPVKEVVAPPVQMPIAPPANNPRFEAAVSQYMADKGVSREEAMAKLLAAKAARGQ